jgi:microcystin-dependent protein
MWPVGSVFISTVATSPAELLGFGTWQAIGAGRVLVGQDAGQTEFDTLGETGGAKTVTLTAAQSGVPAHSHGVTDPGHTHTQQPHSHVQNINSATTGGLSGATPDTSTNTSTASGYSTANATAVNNSNTTGLTVNNATPANAAESHNNLMPYLVCRFWQRTS